MFEVICFDCDSTLSRIEGIDELARRSGQFEAVADLTNQAMDGNIALQQVYGQRLQMIQPKQSDIDWLAQLYIEEVVEGAKETLQALSEQAQLHIISGGLRQAILPLAEFLGVAAENVHAVDIHFDAEGRYAGFAEDSPLARSGGKATICHAVKQNGQSLAMVGDGKTDLEAKQAGAVVIGFGGVAARDAVVKQADHFVDDHSLSATLKYLCGE